MLRAVGVFLLALLAIVIIVYALRRYVIPILGLPPDIGDFAVFVIGIAGLCAAIYAAYRAYYGGGPSPV